MIDSLVYRIEPREGENVGDENENGKGPEQTVQAPKSKPRKRVTKMAKKARSKKTKTAIRKLYLNLEPGLHTRVKAAAKRSEMSVNTFLVEMIESKVR